MVIKMVFTKKLLGKIAAKAVGFTTARVLTSGIVTTVGTASTGTAISSLSGVAARNATLAWLGGGTLAAGGLGIAGGAIVLGAIGIAGTVCADLLYEKWSEKS